MPPKNSDLKRLPPQNLEAENFILGSLLIDPNVIIKVADVVNPEDFYKDAHGQIYAAMRELYAKREPIDILSLSSKLEEKGMLETIGGRTYIANLANSVGTSSNVAYYAELVQRKATLRRLISAASDIGDMGYDEDEEIDKLLDEAERKLFNVSQKFLKQAFQPIDALLSQAFDRIDDLHKQSGKLRGLATGFNDLDGLLAGLQKSDLIILAARPSVGKTSLALDIARQVAVLNKASVGIFSLEMSKEQLVDRMLCAEAGVSLWKMRTGKLSDKQESDDFSRIGQAMGVLAEVPIFIDDSPSANIMEIRTKARRLQMEHKLELLVIDYLQLMEGRTRTGDNRVQEVAEITRSLKGIARELNIPVLALSQLSRAVEQSRPAIPKLAHLRESGSIEQDADVVMFIYRKAADRNYEVEELSADEKTVAQLYIAKHRNGPVGKVNLFFDEETVSFKNLAKSDYDIPSNPGDDE